jgi:hypothetical protein
MKKGILLLAFALVLMSFPSYAASSSGCSEDDRKACTDQFRADGDQCTQDYVNEANCAACGGHMPFGSLGHCVPLHPYFPIFTGPSKSELSSCLGESYTDCLMDAQKKHRACLRAAGCMKRSSSAGGEVTTQ